MSLDYYVYAYVRDDGTPYYIGKGKDRRAYMPHARKDGVLIQPPTKERIILLETNLTNVGACAIERRLIRWWGKKHEGGLLVNLLDGGNGGGSFGFKMSEEQKDLLRKANLGKKQSQETIEKKRHKLLGSKRTDAARANMSKAQKNHPTSDAAKVKMRASALNRAKVQCPTCDVVGDIVIMKRWHFNNCKHVIGKTDV